MENENNNQKDKNTMAILKELDGIHLWVEIIGFYFLMKMVITVIKVTVAIALGMEFIEIINQIIPL